MARLAQVENLLNGVYYNGDPLAAGKVYTYEAGTTTPKTMWTVIDRSASAANPIILDANGKAQVYADGLYKLVIKDADDVTIYTQDNLFFGVDDGAYVWVGTTTGTATAQVASATPAISTYVAGQLFRGVVGGGLGSTGTSPTSHTININGVGVKNIVENYGSSNPTIGSWVAGAIIELQYDGTNFRLMNDAGGWQAWAPALTPSAGSASSIVYNVQSFRRYSRTVDFKLWVTWTQNTASASNVTIACPTMPSLEGQMFPTINNFGAANILGFGVVSALTGSGVITFSKYDSSVFLTGNSWLYCSGTYIAD